MPPRKSRNSLGRPPTIENPQGTICSAAATLFASNGYDATSLQDVAKAVKMTKAGLYHYFPTKRALFDAIVASTMLDLIQAAEAVLRSSGDPREKLVGFMVAHATFLESNHDRYRASFFGRAGGAMSDFSDAQLAERRRYVGILEAILEEVSGGAQTAPSNSAIQARGILGMLNWMARWYRPEGPKSATEIATIYATLVMSGLLQN